MTSSLFFMVLFSYVLCMNGQQSSELSLVNKDLVVKSEFIYLLDDRPTPQCHASTIVEVEDGILAAWFGGTHERHNDVGIWISRNLNGKWSKPVEVVNGFQNDLLRYPCWNPVLFKPLKGPLMLFYKVGPSPSEWWGMLSTSDDNGVTWSNPAKLGENDKVGDLIGPVKNKPLQLNDGTIICPSSTELLKNGETKWRVHFEFTRDYGKSWNVVGPINDGVEFDAIQPSILTYDDGRMQALCRTRQGVIAQSWSEDRGKTWSKMTATNLPNPNAGTDAITLQNGLQMLVYNPDGRTRGPARRNQLNVAVSRDGINWKDVLILENDNQPGQDANTEYSYPTIIQGRNGLVHITYTYHRKTVKYVLLDPSEL